MCGGHAPRAGRVTHLQSRGEGTGEQRCDLGRWAGAGEEVGRNWGEKVLAEFSAPCVFWRGSQLAVSDL